MEDIILPAYEEYRDSLVAFVDVLGFDKDARNIQSQDDYVRVAGLLFAFKETATRYNQDQSLLRQFEMTTMSDSIVVSMPYNDPACAMSLIIMLHGTQYDLLATAHRRLLRGFLTRGRLYHRDGIVFGEGYSRAYEYQEKVGHAPRIVLDPVVVQDAEEKVQAYRGTQKMAHVFNYLRQDPSDGLYFIDYLRPLKNRPQSYYDRTIEEHGDIDRFIDENIAKYRGDLKIRRKYEWLRWYFLESFGTQSTCVEAGRLREPLHGPLGSSDEAEIAAGSTYLPDSRSMWQSPHSTLSRIRCFFRQVWRYLKRKWAAMGVCMRKGRP